MNFQFVLRETQGGWPLEFSTQLHKYLTVAAGIILDGTRVGVVVLRASLIVTSEIERKFIRELSNYITEFGLVRLFICFKYVMDVISRINVCEAWDSGWEAIREASSWSIGFGWNFSTLVVFWGIPGRSLWIFLRNNTSLLQKDDFWVQFVTQWWKSTKHNN